MVKREQGGHVIAGNKQFNMMATAMAMFDNDIAEATEVIKIVG
jgi:hypothetical protein